MHFRSCWTFRNSKFLTTWMFIWYVCFYCIFAQVRQFPVLDFGLDHSGSQPFYIIIIFVADVQDQGNTKPLQNAYLQAFWNEMLIYGRSLSTTLWQIGSMPWTLWCVMHYTEACSWDNQIWLKSPKCFYSYTSGFEFHIIWLYLYSTQSLFRSTLDVVPT